MTFIVSPLVFLSPVFLEPVSSWSRMGATAALFHISLQRGCANPGKIKEASLDPTAVLKQHQ